MKLKELLEGKVIKADFGKKKNQKSDEKPVEPEKPSILDVFGSTELAALKNEGIKLTEKPSYWEDFDDGYAANQNVHEVKLKKIEKILGRKFKVYQGSELFSSKDKPKTPQVSVKQMPKEDMFIVEFTDGTRYLADRTGGNTYIRFWQKIE